MKYANLKEQRSWANGASGFAEDFEPFIRYCTFGDLNTNFSVILGVKTLVDRHLVMCGFVKALKKAHDKEGIEISWPVRKSHYGNS